MVYKQIIIFIVSITLLFGCGSTRRDSAANRQGETLTSIAEKRSFRIQSQWAFPLMTQGMISVANSGLLTPRSSGNRIDLIGNPNFFEVRGDSVRISLPYFGERQIGGGYAGSEEGIRFEGIPLSYTVREEEGKTIVDIQIRNEFETLRFNLFLFPAGRADINMNSSHRTSIRYSGSLKALPDQEL